MKYMFNGDQMTLLTISEKESAPRGPASLTGHPFLALGFRPFYLLAAAFAAVSVPAWLASYYGLTGLAQINLFWHIHEMLFGFVIAVVIGFLYTAGRNWTGLWTPRGAALAGIAGLWVAGRVAMLLPWPVLAAVVDLLFLPVAAWPLYRVIERSDNRRNRFLVGLLALLAGANAVFHAASLGWLPLSPLRAIHAGIIVVVVIEAAIGGRIIPNFTANAVPGAKPVTHASRDRIAMILTAGAGAAWVLGLPSLVAAPLSLGAAIVQGLRLAGWLPLRTLHNPLLWILHVSYAWIPLGFLMLSLSQLGVAPQSAAVHLLAVGALAGLILGMITRTALGHTGRMLRSGTAETWMYVLMQGAVLARLVAALTQQGARDAGLVAAGVCWTAAFVLYVAVYAPYLFQPRVDGKEG